MKKVVINPKSIGILFKKGKIVKVLEPGTHRFLTSPNIDVLNTYGELESAFCNANDFIESPLFKDQLVEIDVKDDELAIVFIDGCYTFCYKSGKHVLHKSQGDITYTICDISSPIIKEELSSKVLNSCPLISKYIVSEGNKGALYINSSFVEILDSGVYYFWHTQDSVCVNLIDTRETQSEITGQEVLTLDKVTIRINLVAFYTVTDFVKIATLTKDPSGQLHILLQLALREYVGSHKLDEILENKSEMANVILENVKAKEDNLFINIESVGIKDIILPGEIRDIMNTVLIAEKKSQANVISRREEVASTRSLLNTAKLMEENKTLYKLKELEYLERICEHVGSINVSGTDDVLSQLTNLIKK